MEPYADRYRTLLAEKKDGKERSRVKKDILRSAIRQNSSTNRKEKLRFLTTEIEEKELVVDALINLDLVCSNMVTFDLEEENDPQIG